MRLSIIVPVYNVENYIKECLESLVNQSLTDYEIIVVNDGSTDNSQLIIDKYKNHYPNLIKSYHKSNGGLSDARNYGLKISNGDYITFVDSDDYVDEHLYMHAMKKIEDEKLDILLFGFIRENSHQRKIVNLEKYENIKETYIKNHPNACNKIFKRELWTDNNVLFPLGLWYEDVAIIPCLIQYTNRIGVLDGYYYHYRMRDNSITSNEKYSEKCLDIVRSLEYLDNHFYDEKYKSLLDYVKIVHGLYLGTQRPAMHNKKEDFFKIYNSITRSIEGWRLNSEIKSLPILKRLYLFFLPNFIIFI